MKGQSLLLLGAGILFGTTSVYAQRPEGGHPSGWYMLYNVHTGVYVYVSYLGT